MQLTAGLLDPITINIAPYEKKCQLKLLNNQFPNIYYFPLVKARQLIYAEPKKRT